MSSNPYLEDVGTKKPPPSAELQPAPWQFGLWQLLILVFICAIAFWIALLLGLALVMGSLLLLVAIVVGIGIILAQRGSARREALTWALAIAAEREMALAITLEAFADQYGGEFRRKVRAVAFYLNRGMSLPEALDHEPGTLPRDAEVLARIGWESGTLAKALRDAADSRWAGRPPWTLISSRLAYFAVVLMAMQSIVGFIMYFIIPKFEAIFKDFGVSLPPITIFVIMASHTAIRYFWLIGVPLLLLEIALVLFWPLLIFGWSRYYVPFFDILFAPRHSALILRSLSWVIEGEKPLPWGIEMLGRCYPTAWVRRRLTRVVQDLTQGQDWLVSLRKHRLIRAADAAVLESAQRVGNLPWALRETADGCERRLAYRLQAWSNLLFPLLVLCLGVLVGTFVVACFIPLLTLIARLAG